MAVRLKGKGVLNNEELQAPGAFRILLFVLKSTALSRLGWSSGTSETTQQPKFQKPWPPEHANPPQWSQRMLRRGPAAGGWHLKPGPDFLVRGLSSPWWLVKHMSMGQNPNRTPVNIPIPTKIDYLPQNGTIGFDPQPYGPPFFDPKLVGPTEAMAQKGYSSTTPPTVWAMSPLLRIV